MSTFVRIIVCIIAGYICGCFSSGYLVGKANNMDIRNAGSGNPGATNALRTLGVKAGLLTVLGDILKVIIPVLVVRYVGTDWEYGWKLYALYVGMGAVLGHNFPFWLNFKGGKGIAVTGGVVLSICDWRITLIFLTIFILIVAVTRYVSLGSLVGVWAVTADIVFFSKSDPQFVHMLVLALIFAALAYIKHWENIKRLLSGTERKIGEKKD